MKRVLVFASVVLSCGIIVFPPAAAGSVSLFQNVHSSSLGDVATVTCTLAPTGSSRNIIVAAVGFGHSGVTTPTVASVVDDRGNTYSPAPNGRGQHLYQDVEVWHAIGTTAGVTQVTVTFGGVQTGYRECYVFEVGGALAYDTAAGVNDGLCKLNICSGAPVVTATTAGFVVGVIAADPIDRSPADGNEFTGGSIGAYGQSAAAVLFPDTPKSHQPVWHNDRSFEVPFASVTAAYKQ
ncbi:MAG: hypothetical protein WAQ52_07940 [Terriglobales bacterium]